MMMVKHVKSTSVVYRIRSAAMAGEFFHLARPIHKYTPEDWKKLGEAEKKAAYKKDKRDKARSAKKERKKAAMGEKAISKVLDEFPRLCNAARLTCSSTHVPTMTDGRGHKRCRMRMRKTFLADVIPAVPARMVFKEDWIPIYAVHYISENRSQGKESRSEVVLQCHGHTTSHV